MSKNLVPALLGVMALMARPVCATVYSPWVLSEHTADTRDEMRFAADPRWATLEGQERALAVWRYLTSRETGTWHFSDMYEGSDPHWESKLVKDPTKLLNVYGFGVCTMHACLIEGLYEALGFGVRQMEFGGYHRTAEVAWEGSWHYLDVDERAYLVNEQGRVVSVTEATGRPELWDLSAQRVSPFYPQNGGVRGISELAKHGPPVAHWHWRVLGHTMDFTLRPGESLTRWWRGLGKWRVCDAWLTKNTLDILEREPRGPKCGRSISLHNSYGNGVFVYEPRLSAGYADFAEGVYRRGGVVLDDGGLVPEGPAGGFAEWRVRSPYVIAGEPGALTDPDDDRGAAAVELTARGPVAVSVSTDQGRHWGQVWRGMCAGAHVLDLTRWVQGRYEYHVRVELQGGPAESRLSALRLTTWVQVAPASLPRLAAGENRLWFTWGDGHGWPTEMIAIEPEFSDPADLRRWEVDVEGRYRSDERTMRAAGPVTVCIEPLVGAKLRWLHLGAAFNAHHAGSRPDRILYSLDPAAGWQVVHEETPPDWNQHWYYNAEADLVLAEPAARVWVRLEPATAANALRVYGHCQPEGARQGGPVIVTHRYRERGELVERSFTFTAPQEYRILCEGEPENDSVTMAVPSRPVSRPSG